MLNFPKDKTAKLTLSGEFLALQLQPPVALPQIVETWPFLCVDNFERTAVTEAGHVTLLAKVPRPDRNYPAGALP